MAIYPKVEKPKKEFVREIFCRHCWKNQGHTIFYVSDTIEEKVWIVRFHRKCDKCGTKQFDELPVNDWNALVEGRFQWNPSCLPASEVSLGIKTRSIMIGVQTAKFMAWSMG